MNLALALCLLGTLPSDSAPFDNFAFQAGTLAGWEGDVDAFSIAPARRHGPSADCAVCSADRGPDRRRGVLHRSFVVPPGAGVIRFTAHVVRRKDLSADGNLDVVLFAAGKRLLPKQTRLSGEWQRVANVLPSDRGRPREYIWDVSGYIGQTLRLAIIDEDKRRDCYLTAGGFRLVTADEFNGRELARTMNRLVEQHRLAPAARFESKHFLAYSNADDEFTAHRLNNCELFYEVFFQHFRSNGFRLHEPPSKLMVAIFDSQAGFEAYIGQRLPVSVTGLYHTRSNRLIVYDYGQNRAFLDQKQAARQAARQIGSDLERRRFVETANRQASEFRQEANIGTVMHEAAHQLSFNCGLLNRDGDVPFWLAEGLATYCEATDNSTWQGIGEPNPERLEALLPVVRGHDRFIPLRDLLERDEWMKDDRTTRLAYAQSWALFKMLMEERTAGLRHYLALIRDRSTPDHRLADFAQAFGGQLNHIELRYLEYMKEQVERYTPTRR